VIAGTPLPAARAVATFMKLTEADMATKTVEKELLDLEKQYWQAIKDNDIDAALRLTYDPSIVAGATGVASIDKQAFSKMMKSASYTLHDFEVKDDVQVRMLNDDVAIVAYKVHEELTVDGKPVSLDAADSSTWVRRNGHWLCALHTEAIAGDPFGRDRQRAK
jgi:ketosteroid isomerase-like protein